MEDERAFPGKKRSALEPRERGSMNEFTQQPAPPETAERRGEPPTPAARDGSINSLDQSLKDKISHYHALIDSTGAGCAVLDRQGRVIEANEVYAHLAGHDTAADVLGRSVLEWTAPDDVGRTVEHIHRCLEQGTVRGVRIRHSARDGQSTSVLIDATTAATSGGTHIVVLCRKDGGQRAGDAPPRDIAESLRTCQRSLAGILASPAFLERDLNELLKLVTRTAVETLAIERASVWRLNEARTALRCASRHDCDGGPHAVAMEVHVDACRTYLHALEHGEAMRLDEAGTEALPIAALRPFGVSGSLDVPILLDGRLDGVLCLERAGGAAAWRAEDQFFAASLANAVTLGIERQERRRVEESLQQGEERYRELAELSKDGVLVVERDHITCANQAALALLGAEAPDQVLDENLFRFIHPLYHDTARNRLRLSANLRATIPFVAEKYLRLDGAVLDVETTSGPCHGADSEALLVIVRDITTRRQAEQRQENTEHRLNLALRATALGLWEWNLQTGEAVFDPAWLQMLGYTREDGPDSIGAWEQIVHPGDLPRLIDANRAHAQGVTPSYEGEYRIRDKAGEWRWLHELGTILERDDEGRPLREFGVTLDITERRSLAEAALAGEMKFVRAFQSNPLPGLIATFPGGRLVEVNDAFLRMTGFAREDVVGQPATDLVLRMEALQQQALYRALTTGATPHAFETRLRLRTGQQRDVLANCDLVDFGGEQCFIGIYYDLAHRKLVDADTSHSNAELEQRVAERTAELEAANTALRAAPARALALLDALPDALYRISRDGTVLDYSAPRGKDFADPERVIGYNMRDLDIEPAALEGVLATVERALASGHPETLEYSLPTARGKRTLEARVLRSGDDEVVATVRDMTGRLRAVERTRVSEKALRAAQEIARIGSFDMHVLNVDDLDANPVCWSDELYRLLGYLPGEVAASNAQLLATVRAEDRSRIRDALLASLHGGERLDMDCRIVRPDATERFVHLQADMQCSDAGRGGFTLYGVLQDITGRKSAENAVKQSEQRLRRIIDAIPHLLYAKDISGRYFLVNQALADLYGAPAEDLLGRTDAELMGVPGQEAPARESDLEVALVGQPKLVADDTITDVHGTTHIIETLKIPVTFPDASLPAVLGVASTVGTRRRQGDDAIRELSVALETGVLHQAAEIEGAARELASFSESVSQRLTAPLRGIDAWTQALIVGYGEQLDDRGRQHLLNIRDEARRMGSIVEEILELSRVARVEMRCEPVDLSALGREIIAGLRAEQPGRNVAFTIEPQLRASGDAELLRILLRKLIERSWDSTATQGQGRIEMGMTVVNGEPAFYLRDNGAGLEGAIADTLSAPLGAVFHAATAGTPGVGLATAQRIAQRHGGRLWAEAIDHGTALTFTLPAAS